MNQLNASTLNPISDRAFLWLILTCNTLITVLLVILLPLWVPLVAATAKRRQTFFKRLGWVRYTWQCDSRNPGGRRVWVHALSVGEVLATQPLIAELLAVGDGAELFLSTSTLTGFQMAERLVKNQPVRLCYFPYDWIFAVRSVVSKIDPTHVVITETDIWPTFQWEMRRQRINVSLVNLRISNPTWKNYSRSKRLVGKVYSTFDRICVQTRTEVDRLNGLGVDVGRVSVTGNFKFDGFTLPTDTDWVTSWQHQLDIPTDHRIVVAGSTHEGEEAILGRILASLLSHNYNVSLVIAPRDPLRGKAVRTDLVKQGLRCELFSDMQSDRSRQWPQVVVVDSIGYLKALYRLAYAAFVGGSMVPMGGHNPLEPAFWAKPVLFGPDMRDFVGVAEHLTHGGGAIRVDDSAGLEASLMHLLDHPEVATTMGQCAFDILNRHRGAVHRTLSRLKMVDE